MKRLSSASTSFGLVCLACILIPGFLQAQENITISPEVRADASKRIENSKTWDMPKQNGFISQKGMVGEKAYRNICNGRPDKNYTYTQSEACSRYMGSIQIVRAIGDTMPQFKACALDQSKNECVNLVSLLLENGFYDYALAVIEAGYITEQVSVLNSHPTNAGALTLYLEPGSRSLGIYHGQQVRQVEDIQDINSLLKSVCLVQRNPIASWQADACSLARATGAAVSQQELAQAANSRAVAEAQSEQERALAERRFDRAAAAQDARLNALSNVAAELSAQTPTIQETAAQQQANLQATAATIQQREQVQAEARLAAQSSQPLRGTISVASRSNTVASPPATSASTSAVGSDNTPSSATAAQGSYNPYTGTGSGSIQGSCTDMTASVKGTVKVGSDGWVIGYLANSSNQTLYVSYTFKQNGIPSTAMSNAGATTIQGGQTVGGEGQGLYSTGADKNPPEIYWYAVLKSEHDKSGCAHKW